MEEDMDKELKFSQSIVRSPEEDHGEGLGESHGQISEMWSSRSRLRSRSRSRIRSRLRSESEEPDGKWPRNKISVMPL